MTKRALMLILGGVFLLISSQAFAHSTTDKYGNKYFKSCGTQSPAIAGYINGATAGSVLMHRWYGEMTPMFQALGETWTHNAMMGGASTLFHNSGNMSALPKYTGDGGVGTGMYGYAYLGTAELFNVPPGNHWANVILENNYYWNSSGGYTVTEGYWNYQSSRLWKNNSGGAGYYNNMAGFGNVHYRMHAYLQQNFEWSSPFENDRGGHCASTISQAMNTYSHPEQYPMWKLSAASQAIYDNIYNMARNDAGSVCGGFVGSLSGVTDNIARGIADQVLNCFWVGSGSTYPWQPRNCKRSQRVNFPYYYDWTIHDAALQQADWTPSNRTGIDAYHFETSDLPNTNQYSAGVAPTWVDNYYYSCG